MERRREDRMDCDIALTCRIPAAPGPARILDISHGGCRLDTKARVCEPGSSIVLEIANGDRVQGAVTWQRQNFAGVRFSQRLKPQTAVFLGLEQPEVVVPPTPNEELPVAPGLLRHWFRRLTLRF